MSVQHNHDLHNSALVAMLCVASQQLQGMPIWESQCHAILSALGAKYQSYCISIRTGTQLIEAHQQSTAAGLVAGLCVHAWQAQARLLTT